MTTSNYRQCNPDKTGDILYWKQLSKPFAIKDGRRQIDYVDFSPNYSCIQPNNFAVTSNHIKIYNPAALNQSSFLCESINNAYGGTFDKDGRMVMYGDEEGYVRLCELSTEREEWSVNSFAKIHTAAVHRTLFLAHQPARVASFSDDRTVRLWDLSNGTCVTTFEQVHTDNIRAACVSPVCPNIIVSGGYDGKAKILDTRTDSVVLEVNHNFPIQSVLFLPTGGILISCGGSNVKIWDVLAGGRLLATLDERDKNVTCLQLTCNGTRLLSGGWDRKVYIYDTASYSLVHKLDFQYPIYSMAVAPDEGTLVVGMADGNIDVRLMDYDREIKHPQKVKGPKILQPEKPLPNYRSSPNTGVIEMLSERRYYEALTTVFTSNRANISLECAFCLLRELMGRKSMGDALKDQPNEFLETFISFLIKHVDDHRFNTTIIDTTNILLDVLSPKFSSLTTSVESKLIKLNRKLNTVERMLTDCLEMKGTMELVLSGANV